MAKMEFETKLEKAKSVLEKLMDPEITLDASIKAYEEGMKELTQAQKMLEDAKLQIEMIKNQDTPAT